MLYQRLLHPFFLLGILFICALFIRLIYLGSIPYGFHEDEAHIGYNAYSILKTGKDKNNVFMPLAIDQFGDYRPSGLHFLTVPSIAAFGLTPFATRLPVAIVGSLSIILLYFLTLEIFNNKAIALLSAAWMTVTPWQVIASRATSESIVAQFFVMLGMYFIFVYFRKHEQIRLLIFSGLALSISFLFYHAARFFVPPMLVYLIGYIFIHVKSKRNVLKTYSITAFCVIIVLVLILKFSNGGNRPLDISVFNSPATKHLIQDQVMYAGNPPTLVSRVLHNKYINYPQAIMSNYLQHFESEFLYFKGGRPPRYQISGIGNFYLVQGIFFFLAFCIFLAGLLKDWKSLFSPLGVVVLWLLIGPIPAAFTYEDIPHFQRSIMMLPAFVMLTSYGLYTVYHYVKNKKAQYLLTGFIFGVTVFSVIYFFHSYYIESHGFQTLYRNEGEKELTATLADYTNKGYSVIATSQQSNTLIFYLFYDKIDPFYYQSIGSPRDKDGLHFKNITFSQAQCPTNDPHALSYVTNPKTIFVNRFDCTTSQDYTLLEDIKRPDSTVAFKIMKSM